MTSNLKEPRKLAPIWRAMIEVGFIIFLFYSNLLMGEFEHSGGGYGRGLAWAIRDVFTRPNFLIVFFFFFYFLGRVFIPYTPPPPPQKTRPPPFLFFARGGGGAPPPPPPP